MEKQDIQQHVFYPNGTGYIGELKAAVVVGDSTNVFSTESGVTNPDKEDSKGKKHKLVEWGEDNVAPQKVIEMVGKSPIMSENMLFNISLGYGMGIIPAKRDFDKDGNPIMKSYEFWLKEQLEAKPEDKDLQKKQKQLQEVLTFIEENDISFYLTEQFTDLNYFFQLWPEIILSNEGKKVTELNHKESAFCRWAEMDENGKLNYVLYSGKWHDSPSKEDIHAVEALDYRRPIKDLKERIKSGKTGDKVFFMPLRFPSPGKVYYPKPYYYSIFESGWYDFAIAIPEFKKTLIQNQSAIQYIVRISDKYFPRIFKDEKITDPDKQNERIKKFYADVKAFVMGKENAGKAFITYQTTTLDGKTLPDVEIVTLDNKFKGGEYIEDSSEVNSIMCYAMNTHPSLIGATPGKTGSNISGSEARELFLIKQIILKPFRDIVLKPFYLIKAINNWPADMEFHIPNMVLTTLDKNKSGTEAKN